MIDLDELERDFAGIPDHVLGRIRGGELRALLALARPKPLPEGIGELVAKTRRLAQQQATPPDNFHQGKLLTAEDTVYWQLADTIEALGRERDEFKSRLISIANVVEPVPEIAETAWCGTLEQAVTETVKRAETAESRLASAMKVVEAARAESVAESDFIACKSNEIMTKQTILAQAKDTRRRSVAEFDALAAQATEEGNRS